MAQQQPTTLPRITARPWSTPEGEAYKTRIQSLSGRANCTGINLFKNYFSQHPNPCLAKVAVVEFPNHSGPIQPIANPCPCVSSSSWLIASLQAAEQPQCRLYILESPCPGIIALLGSHLDVDPLFWVEHLDGLAWYRTKQDIYEDQRLPLPSTRARQSFLHTRTIQSREKAQSDTDSTSSFLDDESTGILPEAGMLKQAKFEERVFSSWFTANTMRGTQSGQAARGGWRGNYRL